MTDRRGTVRAWPDAPWDNGITWFSRRVEEPSDLPISVPWLAEKILRVADVSSEAQAVEAYIQAATQAAEDETQRALSPQMWEMVLSGFPASGRIVLERPPLIEVVSIAYYETDGSVGELAVSPAQFTVAASGAYSKAEVRVSAESVPSAREVVVRYRAGYLNESDAVLGLIKVGIGLMAGELYKQRSLSVQAVHNNKAVLDLARFWRPVR